MTPARWLLLTALLVWLAAPSLHVAYTLAAEHLERRHECRAYTGSNTAILADCETTLRCHPLRHVWQHTPRPTPSPTALCLAVALLVVEVFEWAERVALRRRDRRLMQTRVPPSVASRASLPDNVELYR